MSDTVADKMPLSADSGAGLTSEQKRNLVLASVGSLLEFYEFMVFGFFTVVIGKLFFPAGFARGGEDFSGLRALFAGLPAPPGLGRDHRLSRRPIWPQKAFHGHRAADGAADLADRLSADLRADRHHGADPAACAANPARGRARRGIRRCFRICHGTCERTPRRHRQRLRTWSELYRFLPWCRVRRFPKTTS